MSETMTCRGCGDAVVWSAGTAATCPTCGLPIEVLPSGSDAAPWYRGVTRYQWIVLLIACLGWVFDVFEGQIFVSSMQQAMPALSAPGTEEGTIESYKDLTLGAFLLGGALGGVFFGMLSDRIGRVKTMVYTILMYSFFTCVSSFSQVWWHMLIARFLVAMGVGGEWAVASAMVAEIFPPRARTWSLGIFHASSVFGTYLAVAAGAFLLPAVGWRWCFALGAVPALLTIWVRVSLREPDDWQRARAQARDDVSKKLGRLADLFQGGLFGRTVIGVGLATVGMTTFWGTHIYGKNLMLDAARESLLSQLPESTTDEQRQEILKEKPNAVSLKRWEMLGMLLVTTGGGLGLVSFAPLSQWIGRRGAFLLFHAGGLVASLVVMQVTMSRGALFVALPVFGYMTLGMHAGYAIYFPELFPTRLRGTGAGLCFNFARLFASPVLFISGWLQRAPQNGGLGLSREDSATYLSLLFLVGIVLLLFAPETKGRDLPE